MEQNCGVGAVEKRARVDINVFYFLRLGVSPFCLRWLPLDSGSDIRNFCRFDSQKMQCTAFVLFLFEVEQT